MGLDQYAHLRNRKINWKKYYSDDDKESQEEQKAQGYKYVDNTYDNYNRDDDFIEKLADEIKQNALKQINIDNQKIKDEIIKEDTVYKLVAGSDEKSIVNGDSFKDSEVK